MSRGTSTLLLAYAIAIALFTLGAALGLDAVRLATKPVPVAILAAYVARNGQPSSFRSRVLVGLVLCAVGDLVLETGRFVPGLVIFLVGHLGYLAAFLGETRELHPLRGAPFAAWGALAIALLWRGLGPLALPVALYTATICAMMWRAAAVISRERPWATSMAVGAVLFAASDTLIAVNKFHAAFVGAPVIILALYWLGQLLIATGCARRERRPEASSVPSTPADASRGTR